MPSSSERTKPKRGVVLGMAEHYHQCLAQPVGGIEPGTDERRTDALALAIGKDGHRGECQHHVTAVFRGQFDVAEQDVAAHLAVLFGHQRQLWHGPRRSDDALDQLSLVVPVEGGRFDREDGRSVGLDGGPDQNDRSRPR